MSNSWQHILTISPAVYRVGNNRRTVKTPTTPHISHQSGSENACKTLSCWLFIMIWLLVCNICSHLKVINYCVFQRSQYIFSWQFLKYQYKLITWHVLQNVKQWGRNLVINWMMLPKSGRFWHITHVLLAHKILATQKSELVKYLKTTFSPHVRRLHAHNLWYQKQQVEAEAELRGWQGFQGWARIRSHAETTNHSRKSASTIVCRWRRSGHVTRSSAWLIPHILLK